MSKLLYVWVCATALLLSVDARADGVADAGAPDAGSDAASPVRAPTGALHSVRVVRMRDLLAQAVQHYQRSEFERARTLLQEILGYVGQERSRTAQEAHTYLAFVLVAYGEIEAAVESFERALVINPDLQLSAPAPRIAAALSQARRRFRARVRALDHDPPTLVHLPPPGAKYGSPLEIVVQASDLSGVKRLVLNYRTRGDRGFSLVRLELAGRGRYVATIPTLAVMRPGVEYYVEAWDALGNGPGLKGSSTAPITIKVTGGPRAAPSPGPTAWYKRWWVWAIASGVVVAAGGIGLAAYFTRDETARVSVGVPPALNPPGGK